MISNRGLQHDSKAVVDEAKRLKPKFTTDIIETADKKLADHGLVNQ